VEAARAGAFLVQVGSADSYTAAAAEDDQAIPGAPSLSRDGVPCEGTHDAESPLAVKAPAPRSDVPDVEQALQRLTSASCVPSQGTPSDESWP